MIFACVQYNVFTESGSVCVWVCVPSRKPRFLVDWRLLVKERIANTGIPLDVFGFFKIKNKIKFPFWTNVPAFGSLQTSILCIMRELARGGSVAVAVGVSDRWHATRNTWHMTCDTWHLTYDTWYFFFFLSVRFCLFWYRCYYPHTSRVLVPPVCRIFFIWVWYTLKWPNS